MTWLLLAAIAANLVSWFRNFVGLRAAIRAAFRSGYDAGKAASVDWEATANRALATMKRQERDLLDLYRRTGLKPPPRPQRSVQ